jgi:hypothetical protein
MAFQKEKTSKDNALNNAFCDDLRDRDHSSHWMNDAEFKKKHRFHIWYLVRLLPKQRIIMMYSRGSQWGPAHIPVKLMVMGLLHFSGKEGESNFSWQNQF